MSTPAIRKPNRPAFFDTNTLPWTPWVMEGTHFKLLNVDLKSGGFSMLLKVDADNPAPLHGHVGAVEAYIVEGGFAYQEDGGGVGSYVYEEAGSVHQPASPQGCIMFAVLHAPLFGYNDDGTIAGIVDGETMLKMAHANGAADHLNHIQTDFAA